MQDNKNKAFFQLYHKLKEIHENTPEEIKNNNPNQPPMSVAEYKKQKQQESTMLI